MKIYLALLAAIILFSCDTPAVKEENANIKVNDVTNAYNQCGNGDTTLLFVHGWCINKEYWNNQSMYFCNRYNVVTLDLPGFGRSDKSRAEWTFEQYADDINEFIKTKKIEECNTSRTFYVRRYFIINGYKISGVSDWYSGDR